MKKSVIILILSIIVCVIAIMTLTENVPMHFDSNGEVTRYGSPYDLLYLSAIILVVNLVFGLISISASKIVAGKTEKDLEKAKQNVKMIDLVGAAVSLGLLLMQISLILFALRVIPTKFIMNMTGVIAGLVLIVAGYATTKTHPNRAIGVRTNQSYESEENWYTLNKKTGKAIMVIGILMALASFTKINFNIIMSIAVLAILVSVAVFSKMEKRK